MGKSLSTRQVALQLNVSDAMVRYYHERGELDKDRQGRGRFPTTFTYDSVKALGIKRRLGKHGKAVRRVLVHKSLERERLALKISGIEAVACDDVLHALDHDHYGMPIWVWPAFIEGYETVIFNKFVTRVYSVVIGDEHHLSERGRKWSTVIEAGELRELTIAAWELIEKRHRQVTLKL